MSFPAKFVYAHGPQSASLRLPSRHGRGNITDQRIGVSLNENFSRISPLFSNMKSIAASFRRAQLSTLPRQIRSSKMALAMTANKSGMDHLGLLNVWHRMVIVCRRRVMGWPFSSFAVWAMMALLLLQQHQQQQHQHHHQLQPRFYDAVGRVPLTPRWWF